MPAPWATPTRPTCTAPELHADADRAHPDRVPDVDLPAADRPRTNSALSGHHGARVAFAGRYGPVAALRNAPAVPVARALLIPGLTGSKEDFAPMIDLLADAGFDTIAVDLPGQYESPGPDDIKAYRPDALAVDVGALVDTVADGLPVVMLGHSYGGLIARAAVIAGADVAGISLLNSGPAKLPEGDRTLAMRALAPIIRFAGNKIGYRFVEIFGAGRWGGLPDDLKAFLAKRFVATNPRCHVGMGAAILREPDRVGELAAVLEARDIGCTIVAARDDDAWGPELQQQMAARLHVPITMTGGRHSPNVAAAPEVTAAVIPAWQRWAQDAVDEAGEVTA